MTIKNSFLRILCVIGILFLSSCSTTLNTQITTFKNASANSQKGTVYILPYSKDKVGSLEFSYYADPLRRKLEELGFQVVKAKSEADYILDLDYGVKRREAESRRDNTMIISTGFGSWRRGGSVGFVLDGDKDTRYEYEIIVQMRLRENDSSVTEAATDTEAGKSIVEISAVSVGKCDSILPVYPVMLDAIFEDFYRANGSNVRIKKSLPKDHCEPMVNSERN